MSATTAAGGPTAAGGVTGADVARTGAGDPSCRPAGLRVVGGPGGTRAHLEDLVRAATTLDQAATALEAAAREVGEVAALVDEGAAWSPLTAVAARGDLDPLLARRTGLAARAGAARDAAAALRTTVDLYRRTDLDVSAFVRAGGIAVGGALGEAGPLLWLPGAAVGTAVAVRAATTVLAVRVLRYGPGPVGFLLRALGHERLRADPGPLGAIARTVGGPGLVPESFGWPTAGTVEMLTPASAAFLLGALPGRAPLLPDPVPRAAGVLRGGTQVVTHLLGTPTRLEVAREVTPGVPSVPPPASSARPAAPDRPGPSTPSHDGRARRTPPPSPAGRGPWTPPAPRNAADVLRQVHRLYPRVGGGPGGAVGVQRIDHQDGRRSWVVTVPGTQTWSPVVGANPADLSTNLELVAGMPDDMTEVVTRAMTLAGVEPGEPVLLAGHSQGGIVAMEVASAPELRSRFSVEMVLTAGSPVGGVELPPEVQALHLEHVQDAVPALEGVPNPDTPHRTTVQRDLTASPSVESRLAAADPRSAHGADVYARTAEELTSADHPSLAAADAAVARVLGDGTATVTSERYVGVRVPEPVTAPLSGPGDGSVDGSRVIRGPGGSAGSWLPR